MFQGPSRAATCGYDGSGVHLAQSPGAPEGMGALWTWRGKSYLGGAHGSCGILHTLLLRAAPPPPLPPAPAQPSLPPASPSWRRSASLTSPSSSPASPKSPVSCQSLRLAGFTLACNPLPQNPVNVQQRSLYCSTYQRWKAKQTSTVLQNPRPVSA